MEVPLSSPPPMQTSSAWYKIPIQSTKQLSISWADTNDSDLYTAQASFTLFEEDFYTEVLDITGYPVSSHPSLNPEIPDPGLPRIVILTPGTYYVYIEDLDGSLGRTVGFLIKEVL